MSSWNLQNEDDRINAKEIQSIPVSETAPTDGQILQYKSAQGAYVPEPVSALPSIQAVSNIGTGDGIWANTITGTANLRSLKAGTNVTFADTSDSITINATVPNSVTNIQNIGPGSGVLANITSGTASLKSLVAGSNITLTNNADNITINGPSIPGSTNIYNSDGTISSLTRTVNLSGNKLVFGPQSATSPAELIIDQGGNIIIMDAYGGSINIGNANQFQTNINSRGLYFYGGTNGINIDSTLINFPKQSGGILKTTLGALSSGCVLDDLNDVIITSPSNGQIVQYNGTNFVNQNAYVFQSRLFVNNSTFTAILDQIYVAPGCTVSVPTTGSGDIGRQITIACSNSQQTTIRFPTGISLLYNETGYSNFSMNSPTGSVTVICIGANTYSFASISGRWGSAVLSFDQPFTASMLSLGQLSDVDIVSPITNQVLKYDGTKFVNSNPPLATNLIFSGTILNGSTLTHIYDWCNFMTITCGNNGTLNMTIELANQDANDVTSMVWDVMFSANTSSGTWNWVQPRNTNNWGYYTYYLFVMNNTANLNSFSVALQKGPSSNGNSLNTFGYFFNIYNYNNATGYTSSITTSPTVTAATVPLSNTQLNPTQSINNFKGTNLAGSTLVFSMNNRINYNIKFTVWTEIDMNSNTSGTLTMRLNGTSIYTTNYHVTGGLLTTTTGSAMICEFGNMMALWTSATLLATNNSLTFAVSNGNTTNSNFTASVTFTM